MKLNVEYENNITHHKITECFELDSKTEWEHDTTELKIELLKYYLKKVCPFINVDKCVDYYDDTMNYTRIQLCLRLEQLIFDEIEHINFFHESELIKFSMNIEENE